jgi:translation initiation factor eIF-2B subunit delta
MQHQSNLPSAAAVLTISVILITALVVYWVIAPSEVSEATESSSTNTKAGEESLPAANGAKKMESTSPANEATTTLKSSTQNGEIKGKSKTEQKGAAKDNKEEKPAAAELKKKAKADKQARRAQKISESTPAQLPKEKLVERPRRASQSTIASGDQVFTPKDSKSTMVNGVKSKPPQKSQITNTSINQVRSTPSVENTKKVALFKHLYYKDAQLSSIAKEKKDVHPAVLALGLQIRNYVICGSSARCVAMLLTFKRVGLICRVFLQTNRSLPDHRVLCHASWYFSFPSLEQSSLSSD